jgi:O-antigen ligase
LIGAGMKAREVRSTESLDGNVYFQLLAQTGTLGLAFYLLFSLNFLLGVYRIWREIPNTHYWHKVLCTSGMGSMASFHVAGLYWPTLSDSHALLLFVFMISSLSYLAQQYDRGLVPDDHSL